MPPNQNLRNSRDSTKLFHTLESTDGRNQPYRCAMLGCGMMGQEHISYMMGYSEQIRIDYLCDPHQPSLEKSLAVMREFSIKTAQRVPEIPELLHDEDELLKNVDKIDLLVVASPNHLHTDVLLRWGTHDITILVEKPVAVNQKQHDILSNFYQSADFRARVWVAMEYRFIPAIKKLISLLPEIGETKMVTIKENRYPFLAKIGGWNRDREKTGDTLVEKCCHFFDLFRLITGSEACLPRIKAIAQRGINYLDEADGYETPVIDSAFVIMPFQQQDSSLPSTEIIGCLELCMYAEGSRHQEEIIVTGTKGRLEAYLPENKVYWYRRPSKDEWADRSVPPPRHSINEQVIDCSDLKGIHGIESIVPTHSGYHYSSTAVEWHRLVTAMDMYEVTHHWKPDVSMEDGLHAVQLGLKATEAILL